MLLFLLYPLLLFAGYRTYKLYRNYTVAKKIGLPIIIIPASLDEPLWVLIRPLFSWVQWLPFGMGSWYLYTDLGWPTLDRTATHSRLGDSFTLVSPAVNHIFTAYPPAVQNLYRKYKTWIKPPVMTEIFNVYGHSLSGVNTEDWQRHSKITAPAFNDHNFQIVWDESLRQSRDWLLTTEKKRENKADFEEIREDVSLVAMHVLAAAEFGTQSDFDKGVQVLSPGHDLSLIEALNTIHKDIILTMLFAGLKAPEGILPSRLRKLKQAVREFKLYMEESVLRQMRLAHSSSPDQPNTLVAALVKANEEEKRETKATSIRSYLSDEELYGNLFVFNLAGFETTAGTMTFTLAFLAAYPEFQEWVREEVDIHFASEITSYEDTFPKMTRCLALMYEILRLTSPAPQMVRWAKEPQLLATGPNEAVEVPPGTYVSAHFYHVHLNPTTWGSDAGTFNPKRFLAVDPVTGKESLAAPPEGAGYIPWLTSPRVCPGKKFSQVEFIAVIGTLLQGYSIEPLVGQGQSPQQARAKLLEVADDFYFNVSTHLKRPREAGVRFIKRKTTS